MQKPAIKWIGPITIKSIRDFILDNGLTENDTILLNQVDLDLLATEYRQLYNSSLITPYYLLRVLISEDYTGRVPDQRLGVIEDDNNRSFNDYESENYPKSDERLSGEIIYRCGWCGNFVGADGEELDSVERARKIRVYETHQITNRVHNVNGACCPNGSPLKEPYF